MRAPVTHHEEQLVRRLDQVESDFRATKETLEVYKAAMEAETLPNIVALRGRLGELGYLISLDDLRFSLRAEGLRVIAWGDRGG